MLHSQDDIHNIYLWVYNKSYAYENMQHTKLKQVKQLECVIIRLEANYDTIKQYIFHWESSTIWSLEANECALTLLYKIHKSLLPLLLPLLLQQSYGSPQTIKHIPHWTSGWQHGNYKDINPFKKWGFQKSPTNHILQGYTHATYAKTFMLLLWVQAMWCPLYPYN